MISKSIIFGLIVTRRRLESYAHHLANDLHIIMSPFTNNSTQTTGFVDIGCYLANRFTQRTAAARRSNSLLSQQVHAEDSEYDGCFVEALATMGFRPDLNHHWQCSLHNYLLCP
jgi:hypothetical protein